MLTQFMNIIIVIDDMEEITTTTLMFISIISLLFKANTAVTRRNDIIEVIKIVQEKPCEVCSKEETNIQIRFDRLIRLVYISKLTFNLTQNNLEK